MANQTTNIGLRKPVPTENFDIDRDFNANWDTIDEELGNLEAGVANTYTKAEVDTKDSLKADKADTYTKTEVDGKDALKADLSEIESARGTEPTLGARLDADKAEVSGQLAETEQEMVSFKEEYTQYKDNNNLKIAKVEKDVNDYQSTMASMNPNQEVKQKATGYGVVSLPKNSANGQVSVATLGNTKVTKNIFQKTGTITNVQRGITVTYDETNQEYTLNGTTTSLGNIVLSINTPLNWEIGTKYTHSRHKTSGSITLPTDASLLWSMFNMNASLYGLRIYEGSTNVNSDVLALSADAFEQSNNDGYQLVIQCLGSTGIVFDNFKVKIQIERGTKYTSYENHFTGTKSTISAGRLKSVGKNLVRNGNGENALNYWTPTNKSKFSFSNGYFELRDSANLYSEPFKLTKGIKTIQLFGQVINSTSYGFSLLDLNNTITGTPMYVTTGLGTYRYTVDIPQDGYYKLRITVAVAGTTAKFKEVLCYDGDIINPVYEPYKESTSYLPNVGELRSLPNGVKDEVRVSGGKAEHIKKVSDKVVLNGSENWIRQAPANIFYTQIDSLIKVGDYRNTITADKLTTVLTHNSTANMDYSISGYLDSGGSHPKANWLYIRLNETFTDVADVKAWLQANPVTLTYQLAEPIITPIEVSGTLLSNPSGTVYVEKVVADAGIYNNDITTQYADLPIKTVDKLIKYDFETGVQTPLDVSKVVVNANKLSFTHPDLVNGDMVFYDYFYDVESTEAETEIEYYDSRHTIEDTTNGKFYSWKISSTNGVASVALTEV